MSRILLYGRSLFFAGLQASLSTVPDLDLQDVEAQTECLQERMFAWTPDVLIFESTGNDRIPSLAVLKDYPNLLLIGIDTECNELLVFSGHQQAAFCSTDLVKVIHQQNLPQNSRSK